MEILESRRRTGQIGFDGAISNGILKNFGGGIYELRAGKVRLLGFRTETDDGQALVIVEGFKKSAWKTLQKRNYLARARRLRDDWLRRYGKAEGGR